MSVSDKRFIKIFELAAGAEAANTHCVFDTNRMNGFVRGLNAAMEILNAESDEQAAAIAAKFRRNMASCTGTVQENWRVGEIVPDKNWEVKE